MSIILETILRKVTQVSSVLTQMYHRWLVGYVSEKNLTELHRINRHRRQFHTHTRETLKITSRQKNSTYLGTKKYFLYLINTSEFLSNRNYERAKKL